MFVCQCASVHVVVVVLKEEGVYSISPTLHPNVFTEGYEVTSFLVIWINVKMEGALAGCERYKLFSPSALNQAP